MMSLRWASALSRGLTPRPRTSACAVVPGQTERFQMLQSSGDPPATIAAWAVALTGSVSRRSPSRCFSIKESRAV